MNRYHFKTSRCLLFTQRLMVIGLIFVMNNAAMAAVTINLVDSNATLENNDQRALVTGMLTCPVDQGFNVGAELAQLNSAGTALDTVGFGEQAVPGDSIFCTGEPQPFRVPVDALLGKFTLGRPTTYVVGASACRLPTAGCIPGATIMRGVVNLGPPPPTP